ncbi:MAG TPA: bifunctional diaminohydroxyphosphoribosylaminopyrimidine deaminase/5-amino-6-(5-phosphoribosylamino)uracil reductase RibD [Polyangiaceae bacterium]|nr:bifunctional diaminohydroxyphosphoribosylaminopyrimidine deaminase/5-amino-6-(5-phosphoribosylamino)uracil reductase RibD [Polyangiaceae bacterium]
MTDPKIEAAFSTDDDRWMALALEQAAFGAPSPNPHVGAVVVRDGVLVGKGHHERAGDGHAETIAIEHAGDRARGSTLYVTLEPCNHVGRTPPCTEAIVASKIARVVVGCLDPNPDVIGGGAGRLREAGIVVDIGCREADARRIIAPWSKFITTGFPYVALKLALSLDGRIASRTGASKWVTGPEARARVHLLRAQQDAVIVGIGTVLADDPRLTVRDAPGNSPLRVVFDSRLRLPLASRLVQTAREVPTWALCTTDAPSSVQEQLIERGVEILHVPPSAEGRIDPAAGLRQLASRGIVKAMIEGGAELAGSYLAGGVVDELHAFIAPILLGPRGRPGAVDWAGPATPAEAPCIADPQWEVCGNDAHVWGPLRHPSRPLPIAAQRAGGPGAGAGSAGRARGRGGQARDGEQGFFAHDLAIRARAD